jgi:hypothetical protein
MAWHVALASATGNAPDAVAISPVTGQPLRVQLTPREVRVAGLIAAHDEVGLPVRNASPPARVAGKP